MYELQENFYCVATIRAAKLNFYWWNIDIKAVIFSNCVLFYFHEEKYFQERAKFYRKWNMVQSGKSAHLGVLTLTVACAFLRTSLSHSSLHESFPNFIGQSVCRGLKIYLTEQTFTCPTKN